MLLKNTIVPKKSANVHKNSFFYLFKQFASNVRFKQATMFFCATIATSETKTSSNSMPRLLFFITICTILASCANSQKRPKQSHTKPSNADNWSFTGKFALSNGKENGSGKIAYEINNQTVKAQFKAPLGQGSWTITENKNSAELQSSRHHPVFGNNAQALISNELGWDFPWNNLKFWLRAHKTYAKITPHTSSIDKIYDNGWTISYSKWTQTPAGLLPKKIKASKPPYAVKLVIYKWVVD